LQCGYGTKAHRRFARNAGGGSREAETLEAVHTSHGIAHALACATYLGCAALPAVYTGPALAFPIAHYHAVFETVFTCGCVSDVGVAFDTSSVTPAESVCVPA